MQISLDTVREEPFTWQEQLTIPADRLGVSDLVELEPISVDGRIEFFDPHFHFRLGYGYRQVLQCCRCLKPIDEKKEGEIDTLIEIGGLEEPTGEVRLETADLAMLQVTSEELDTEPILIDELLSNIPMKPLCQPACKGLCGECGADLNQGDCSCDKAKIDPRWEALAALKVKSDDKD